MELFARKASLTIFTLFTVLFLLTITPNSANLANYYAYGNTGSSSAESAYANYENHIKNLYYDCNLAAAGLSFNTFKLAVTGFYNLRKEGKISPAKEHLAIIDFTKPSSEKRLFIVDLFTHSLVFNTYVAHGKNSGLIYAERFSNSPESLQSSLGFYITDETYYGQHGYSLRLDGQDLGFNENARSRAIVMHGAPYVGESFVNRYGRTGLSWGCPAISLEEHKDIIDFMKSGNCLFIYGNNISYLNNSRFLNFNSAANYLAQN
ncbi:hypothetical protein C7N43_21095 [Sphingobacteriales bacterium UPWRP_1]|nr:hypothetical protein B6N25_03320 [Sphingobacteriales bacterium TSM_CSS]PSJ75024.1 hypothetical protein C7N43_21095 [Sphingobacteriales bacterium UPWRP_1]